MFRDDREALATQNEEIRRDNERLRLENVALRAALQQKHQGVPVWNATVYNNPFLHLSDGERVVLGQHRLQKFPAWLAVLLHVCTLGLFSIFYFGTLHQSLPRVLNDDPTAGRAIGFMFIPYFNYYWMFFSPLRLVDRINLQYHLRGEAPPISRGGIVASAALSFLFYTIPFVWLFSVWQTQRAINKLVDMGPVHLHTHQQQQPQFTGVRVTDDVAQQQPQQFQPQHALMGEAQVFTGAADAPAAKREGT